MIRRTLSTARLGALIAATLAISLAGAAPTMAATGSGAVPSTGKPVHLTTFEHRLLQLMNHDRAVRGMHPLTITPCAEDFARRWTQTMAKRDVLAHNPALSAMWSTANCRDASLLAENIGRSGTSADALYVAYMNSPEHRANILNPKLRYVGIGSWQRSDGTVYDTVDFANGGSPKYMTVKRLGQGLRAP
ncbi:MAG: hypothetical protein QOE76_3402 [Frankiales bacterium]|jgi:uncharacterized protein YkwD|nr:hypothetical protein [Frankiales bacterium]MDX6245679.1 hypothetical protein [Frankiales bacterium]